MDSICKLCQKPAKLKNSHVIPEFCYGPIYDEKHRFKIVGNVPSTRRTNLQKGLREYLLCGACEQKIGDWETYVSRIFHGIDQVSGSRTGDTIVFEGLQYAPMKLFLLSLLWRAGVSTLPVFRETNVGEHDPILRKMLLAADPGPPELYSCHICSVTLRGYRLGALYGPQPCYINDVLAFRMLVGGFLLIYFVSAEPLHSEITSRFLTCSGSLVVEEKEIHQIPTLNSLAAEIAKDDLR
jgi:hypothetical protein